ncbi:porin family protein [Pontibacter silvestris]|uniref:Porin family protein n=1 Tax=Pontibacter silvestris TaxID=2305183 RepID=A0ABW4WXT8_9BACT|nr:porin family protein [Pontibacter silvestris]MCC9136480.1 PorT family protein [Pontibacter silvestris]
MKKTITIIALTFLPLLTAQAQYTRFGAKVGGGFTHAVGSDAPSDEIRHIASLNAGFIYSYEFVSALAVQAELNYAEKGFVYEGYPLNDDEYMDGDIRLRYIELPLLAKIRKGGLFAEAGPYVAYLVDEYSQTDRLSSTNQGSSSPVVLGPQEYSINDFNRFDYGYTVGVGIIMDNGFFLSVRNTGGLRSFSKNLTQRNMAWQLSIGYLRPPQQPANLMY